MSYVTYAYVFKLIIVYALQHLLIRKNVNVSNNINHVCNFKDDLIERNKTFLPPPKQSFKKMYSVISGICSELQL